MSLPVSPHDTYSDGRAARLAGASEAANPHSFGQEHSWWFAGWADKDNELKNYPALLRQQAT